ncbi:hypothetical protein HELRODRAFT_181511 [Helobdella robusta]|uniref:Apple domain-containing protein n=1 Tax=Helobdella robusta TaxID=6412 RepID=T1FH28_HELRO|nr:hypothetical protein HELRODRAFT_181511 [Helobdella robusta]ESN92317.1 hypothetical protein HELRODRAFT_181511 [Helobdella robusta]
MSAPLVKIKTFFQKCDCWAARLSYQYVGLSLQNGVSTLPACKAVCENLATCVLINLDSSVSPPTCWVQETGGLNNITNDNFLPNAAVTSFQFNRTCRALVSELCWSASQNTRYIGLTQQTTISTEQSCKNYCASLPFCVLVDLDSNTSPSTCWVQATGGTNDVNQNNFIPTNFINNYRLNRTCLAVVSPNVTTLTTSTTTSGGVPRTTSAVVTPGNCWTVRNQTQYFGLTQQSNVLTVTACLDICARTPACLIVNFDTSTAPSTCWIQTTSGPLVQSSFQEQPFVTSFILDRNCLAQITSTTTSLTQTTTTQTSPLLLACWTAYNRTLYIGLEQSGITNLNDCLLRCQTLSQCFIADFDLATNPPCWLKTDSSPFNSSNVITGVDGITDYRLNRSCLSRGGFCWNRYPNTRYLGLQNVNYNTVDDCKNYCFSQANCFIMNFDTSTSPPCWVQADGTFDPQNTLTNQPTVDGYKLEQNCTIPSNKSNLCWFDYPQTRSIGLTNVNYYTLEQCRQFCQNSAVCYVFDYDVGTTPPCWVQTEIGFNPNNLQTNVPSVTHYRLQFCTGSTSTTVSVPMTVIPKLRFCWNTYAQSRYIGLQQVNFYDIKSCQDYCFNLAACYIMDFDTNSQPPCWVQTSGTFDSNFVITNQPTVTNFRLETCPNVTSESLVANFVIFSNAK